jgi:hypothetical protein
VKLHSVARFRMYGFIPQPPQVFFMSLCIMKHWKTIWCLHRGLSTFHSVYLKSTSTNVWQLLCCTWDISVRYTCIFSGFCLVFDKVIDIITSLIISLKLKCNKPRRQVSGIRKVRGFPHSLQEWWEMYLKFRFRLLLSAYI